MVGVVAFAGFLKFPHISARFCITVQTSEARFKTKKERMWRKFELSLMLL